MSKRHSKINTPIAAVIAFAAVMGNSTMSIAGEQYDNINASQLASDSASSRIDDVELERLMDVYMSWAVYLSGYKKPLLMPRVEFVDDDFFKVNACKGQACDVISWYNANDTIYVHEKFSSRQKFESTGVGGYVVHEIVHYLQDINLGIDFQDCENVIKLEREAYGVHEAFVVQDGSPQRPFQRPVQCDSSVTQQIDYTQFLKKGGHDPKP